MSAAPLVEFLTARLDELEAATSAPERPSHRTHMFDAVGTFSPTCVACRSVGSTEYLLADIAAKRRLIDQYGPLIEEGQYFIDYGPRHPGNNVEDAVFVLVVLAQPYADHPDFDPAWKL